jgi:hypothetical protein
VNAIAALLHDVLDFGKPVFSPVLCLQRASGAKAGPDDREDYGVKDWLELRVEGAVDEYVSRKRSRHLLPLEWGAWRLSKSTGLGISIDPIAKLLPDGGNRLPYLLIGEMFRPRDLLQDSHAVVRPSDGFVLSGSGASRVNGGFCHSS